MTDSGVKHDASKPDTSLLLDFSRALIAVAEISSYGAEKYTRGGWKDVPNGITRYSAAMIRHLLSEQTEDLDSDSGLSHAAMVAWNAIARLDLILREEEYAEEQAITAYEEAKERFAWEESCSYKQEGLQQEIPFTAHLGRRAKQLQTSTSDCD